MNHVLFYERIMEIVSSFKTISLCVYVIKKSTYTLFNMKRYDCQYTEIINIWKDKISDYPDFVITHCMQMELSYSAL